MENLWWAASVAGKAVALAGAFACYYAAILLYPDEQGRIQNKLEDWWVAFDDIQKQSLSEAAMFMRRLTTLATNLLDVIFGEKLISLRFVGVSLWLSVASEFLSLAQKGFFARVSGHLGSGSTC